jgi:hypothetical protein
MIASGTIVNEDVNASAAIAGTKISPNFGSQNVVTTGTSTAASFIPTSSSVPTNGVYLPSANNVAISTNGTGRLFVDADGNVILGASSLLSGASGRVLQIGNTSDAASTLQFAATTTGSSYIQFGDSGSPGSYAGYLQYGHTDNFLAIGTNSTEKLRIDSSGRLGLGTSSPSYRLHAVQASEETNPENNAGAYWLFQNSSTTLNTCSALSLGTNSDIGTTVVAQRVGANNEHVLKFQVRNSSGSLGTRMTLTGSGSLGIGTSSPTGTFTVYDSGNQIVLNAPTSSNANITFQENGSNKWIAGYVPFISAFRFSNGSSDILTLTNTGNVGIGTTTPRQALTFGGLVSTSTATPDCIDLGATYTSTSASTNLKLKLYIDSSGNTYGFTTNGNSELEYYAGTVSSPGNHVFLTGGSERARITSSGQLLVGTSTARGNFYNSTGVTTPQLQVEGTTYSNSSLCLVNNNTSTNGGFPMLVMAKSAGSSVGSNTAVSDGHVLGQITFQGNDGTEFVGGADITAYVDGTSGANDLPTRLVFSTTADGASSPTERMRITNAGNVTIGTDGTTLIFNQTSVTGAVIERTGAIQLARSGDQSLLINRISDDGTLVSFYQDGTVEGTISVSGSTVGYNGAHLSRWSQLPGGAERKEILRGTVLSNIDEMCAWGEEDNEQLNRMKVSDVEGDPNVAGVFQAWDDDDDTYTDDFYCAMTGDFIIRIAEGVTVQRGDLLMSTGDGTAKPQDDDIIRSKTIAKVTSNHITCTYDDGSYCVPCVLMAC